MRIPGSTHDPTIWRHQPHYTYAVQELRAAIEAGDRFGMQVRLERVYIACGQPFGRCTPCLMVWAEFNCWTTSS